MPEKKEIRVYDLNDETQHADDLAYWRAQSAEMKLDVLERLRASARKLVNTDTEDGEVPRFRRLLRITELE